MSVATDAIILGTSFACGIGSSMLLNSFIVPYNYKYYFFNDTIYNAYEKREKQKPKEGKYKIFILIKDQSQQNSSLIKKIEKATNADEIEVQLELSQTLPQEVKTVVSYKERRKGIIPKNITPVLCFDSGSEYLAFLLDTNVRKLQVQFFLIQITIDQILQKRKELINSFGQELKKSHQKKQE